jgi:hypothetical protein
MVPIPTKTTPTCDPPYQNTDVILISPRTNVESSGLDPSPLRILPPELIFRVLDSIMYPHEYSGFPCTCQRALSLAGQKLKISEYYLYHPRILEECYSFICRHAEQYRCTVELQASVERRLRLLWCGCRLQRCRSVIGCASVQRELGHLVDGATSKNQSFRSSI